MECTGGGAREGKMRTALLASVLVALALASLTAVPGQAQRGYWGRNDTAKHWRLSGSFDYFTGDTAQSVLGNGFNVEGERSLGGVEGGDLSAIVGYRRLQKDTGGFSNHLNYYSAGIKWRAGPGAWPSRDGFYYGAGLGLAVLDSEMGGNSDTSVGVEWRGLAGLNFARSWFGEVDYVSPSDAQGVNIKNVTFSLGVRF